MTTEDARMLGRYQLLFMLGQGGMGEVHLARLTGAAGFEKLCIVKTVLPHLMGDQSFIDRFHHEARVLVQLTHSNIAQVYDMGEVDGTLYMSIEYVPGVDLSRVETRIERGQTVMPIPMAIAIGQKIGEALGYAHRKVGADGQPLGIVHRDVSPQNVMVSYEGEVKVIDFGLAKSSARSKHTLPSTVMGKLGYMSPEQAVAKPVDHRSDIFSAGIVLWEMLAGRSMYSGGTMSEMVAQMAVAEVPSLRDARPDISPALEQVVMRALAREPGQRYQRADDLARALNELAVRESMTVSAEDLGNYVRSMCPEEFAAERQLQSKLSVMRRKGPAPEVEPAAPELEGTFLRPSGEAMTPAQRAVSMVQPSGAQKTTPAPRARPKSEPGVQVSDSLIAGGTVIRTPAPQAPPPGAAAAATAAAEGRVWKPAQAPQPAARDEDEAPIELPKSKTPLIIAALVVFIMLAGAALLFTQRPADPPVAPTPVVPVTQEPIAEVPAKKEPEPVQADPPTPAAELERVTVAGKVWKVLHREDEDVVLLDREDTLTEGQRMALVGEAGEDGKRPVYGHGAVVEVKGSFAVLLFDDENKLPDKIFAAVDADPRPVKVTRAPRPKKPVDPTEPTVNPAPEPKNPVVEPKTPAPEPKTVVAEHRAPPTEAVPVKEEPRVMELKPKPAAAQLFGTVRLSAPNAVGNRTVLVKSQNAVALNNCELRLPNNVVYRFPRTIGPNDNVKLSIREFATDPRAPDPQFAADWAAMYCAEGTGYWKTTFDRR